MSNISVARRSTSSLVTASGPYSVPNFADFASLCGADGVRVETAEELDAALERALGHSGPSMVEVLADPQLV